MSFVYLPQRRRGAKRKPSAFLRLCGKTLLLCIALSTLCACAQTSLMPAPSSQFFQEAGTARNFTLPSMNGSKKSLSDYSGQFVMLHFWATWCMSCIPEMRELQKLETELSHKGLKIVAVSIDSTPGPVAQFIKRQRLSFDILLDQSGSILERYNSASLPVTFLISPDGALLRFEDPDTGEITYKIEGSREWSDKPHNSLLQAFLSRS